jgi:hypothetical protein
MDEVPDSEAAFLALHDWNWQFSLGTIASLHNLANAKTAMLDRNVRLVTIGCRFHGC